MNSEVRAPDFDRITITDRGASDRLIVQASVVAASILDTEQANRHHQRHLHLQSIVVNS